MYTVHALLGSVADTAECTIVGPESGSEAVGAGVTGAVVVTNATAVGEAGGVGTTLADGDGLPSMGGGGTVTRMFIAANTPAIPMPTTANTGTMSTARENRDFLRGLILRVCGTVATAAEHRPPPSSGRVRAQLRPGDRLRRPEAPPWPTSPAGPRLVGRSAASGAVAAPTHVADRKSTRLN